MTVITNYEKDVPKSPYFKLQNSAKDENMFCHHLIFSGIQMTTRDRGRSVGRFPKCVYIYISYRVISYHIISYYIILYHIISYYIISYYIILYYICIFNHETYNKRMGLQEWGLTPQMLVTVASLHRVGCGMWPDSTAFYSSSMMIIEYYPLVNVYIAMEDHHL